MSGNGAYEGEMNEVALFRSALRAAVPTQPDPRLGADLVPQMARIAREASLRTGTAPAGLSGKRSRPRSRFALVARVGIAAATLPLLIAGLAFAGVTVPEPARSALESVGVDLPNQPADDGAGKESGAAGEATSKQDEPAPAAAPAAAEHKAAGQAHGKAKSKATTNAKAKTKTKTKSNGDDTSEPGRRVRRHGEGPIPGPASPPEGKALGQSNPGPSGQGSARSRGASRGKAGVGSRTVGVGSRKAGVGSRKAGVGSGKAVGSGNGQGAMRGSGQAK